MRVIRYSVATLLALLMAATAWADEAGPRQVIETTVNEIINALEAREDKTALTEKDRDTIRNIVEGRFDYEAMASRSLGKPWKTLDKAEQAHFTSVFRELLERSYGNRLNEYSGQKVLFQDAELKEDKARVKSMVIDANKEIPVDYSMHKTPTGWQVYDIRIEGTSMVRTFYQDFKSILDSGGYAELLKTLEEKIAKLKANEKA